MKIVKSLLMIACCTMAICLSIHFCSLLECFAFKIISSISTSLSIFFLFALTVDN